jgi:cytochrome c2
MRLVRFATISVAWLVTLGAAFLAGAYVYREKDAISAWLTKRRAGVEVIQTGLYNVAVQQVSVAAHGRDGAIDALADGILFVNRLGESWYVETNGQPRKLSLQVPINYEEFESDPFNSNTVARDRFAVKDILIQSIPTGIRLIASFNFWQSSDDCYFLRVAWLETTEEGLLGNSADINAGWRTAFDTVPCRGLTPTKNGATRTPTIGAGGRLVSLSESTILLSVGGFGAETLSEESVAPPNEPRSYGNTVLIDLVTGESRNFTKGHRNPQGLAVSADGTVWLTDHGARGGDELNRVVAGRDYGHPSVSYGTEYESLVWRRNPHQGRHEGFEKPIFAWIPSIAASQLAVIQGTLFERWQGDLLVSSLKAQTLFRLRPEDGRIVFSEPVPIGHRIRDIVEAGDGSIVLKTDDNLLLFLRPLDASTMYRMDIPAEVRGQVLSATCASCHAMAPDEADGIGPNLWGVVGRRIASRPIYDYSTALRSVDGTWDTDSLAAFIADPQAFAPGTTMATTTALSRREVEDLVAYLADLR